jgi:hypothetical protein
MNITQKVILKIGSLIFFIITFLVLVLPLFSIPVYFFLLIIIGTFTLIFYRRASSPSVTSITSPVNNKEQTPYPGKSSKLDVNTQRLDNLVSMTENKLFKLSTVFPFKLFQDNIIIEQKQIIIERSNFFFSSQQYSFSIKDILAPEIETSFLFAKLKLELGPGGFQQNPPSVSYLKKTEAQKAMRIIMGLIICDKEKIDLTNMSQVDVLNKVEEIGRHSLD